MPKKIIFKNAEKTFQAEVDYETKSNKKIFVSTKPIHGYRYEGFVKDDKPFGAGKLFDKGIRFYEGNWKNGYFDGDGCLYDFRGIFPKYEATFKEGKMKKFLKEYTKIIFVSMEQLSLIIKNYIVVLSTISNSIMEKEPSTMKTILLFILEITRMENTVVWEQNIMKQVENTLVISKIIKRKEKELIIIMM
jgi:hypothetical protein